MKLIQLASLALAAPASQQECPTAKRGDLNWFFWTTTSYDDRAVWADGNNQTVIGSELFYEQKRTWDPINHEGVGNRKYCHQLFVQNADGSNRKTLGSMRENALDKLFAYPSQGYLLVHIYVKATARWEFQLLSTIDGSKIATLPNFETFGDIVPSPSGDLIAVASIVIDEVTLTKATANIKFYNPKGEQVGTASSIEFPSVPVATWNTKGQFLLVESSKTVEVSLNGVADAPAPRCVVPKTTSTETNLNGQVLGTGPNGKIEIVNTAGPENTFGCQ